MQIKKLNLSDMPMVLETYREATQNMIDNNIFQWDEIYPNENGLREDILKESMYGGVLNNEIVSLFVLNKEFDESYLKVHWQYSGENFIVLHRLCVRVEFQNRQIGTQTVIAIEKEMRQRLIKSIRLDAFTKNFYALKMYEKLNYRKVGQGYFRKGIFYIFEKAL